MPAFSAKQILVNNQAVGYVQNTFDIDSGYGEQKVRTAVNGKSTAQVLSQDLETAVSKVMFEILTLDSNGNDDPRELVKTWKQQGFANSITVIPDGDGKNQYFGQMALTNRVSIKETPDGTIALVWEGKPNQLS